MEVKNCTKCKCDKELSKFYKSSRSKDGLKSWCKECQSEDNKKREKNYNEQRRLYRLEHKEEYRENKRLYYIDNKDQILTNNASWRQTFNGRLMSYKRAAKKRNIEWMLTEDEFKSFWQLPCNYCSDPIDTIGIDRVENHKGYSIDNCTPCCSICNKMKMDLSKDDFINKITQILKNIKYD
jgi:hypothetical protein